MAPSPGGEHVFTTRCHRPSRCADVGKIGRIRGVLVKVGRIAARGVLLGREDKVEVEERRAGEGGRGPRE